jgi:S1-C subfamily serine protease
LRNRVSLSPVGTTLELAVLRGNDTKKVNVAISKTAEKPQKASFEPKPKSTREMARGATFSDSRKGVVITEVEQGGSIWLSGLRPNDVVVGVNRKSARSAKEVSAALAEGTRQTALFLKRDGHEMLMVVQ